MSKITAEMALEIRKFREALRDARKLINDFRQQMEGKGSESGRGFSEGVKKTAGAVALGNVLAQGFIKAVAKAKEFGLAAARQFMAGVKDAAEMERLEVSFEILTGSQKEGKRVLSELRADALRTGVALEDQAGSMRRFLAMEFPVDEALKLSRSILDIAGATGMSSQEAALLGMAISQVAAKGVASMEELRQQIGEKGVPVFKALADEIGVGTDALIKMISAGKVSADQVISLFMNLEGSFARFRGGAERMGALSGGMFARMGRHVEEFRRRLMEPVEDALKPVWDASLKALEEMTEKARLWGKTLGMAAELAVAMFQTLSVGDVVNLMAQGWILAAKSTVNVFVKGMVASAVALGSALSEMAQMYIRLMMIPAKKEFWSGLMDGVTAAGKMMQALLLDAAAMFLEALAKVPFAGKFGLGGAAEGARTASGVLKKEAAKDSAAAVTNLGGIALTEWQNAVGSLSRVVADFATAYATTPDALNTAPQVAEFALAAAKILNKMAENQAKFARDEAAGAKDGESREGSGGVRGVAGIFRQAVNLIQGRSVQELIADEARQQTKEAKKTNENLAGIDRRLQQIEKNTGEVPDFNVELVPTFS